MRRSALKVGALVAAAGLALAACGGSDEPTPTNSPTGGSDLTPISIGITQIAEHASLDAAREGFKKALLDAGYVVGTTVTFDEQNAQGEMATATAIATKFKNDNVDLILAIATPTAQAAAQVVTDIPVLFTAVTEPAVAGLVETWEKPGGNFTGTSDLNPVARQIELVKEIAPDAKTVGVIYSSGEVNSEVQLELAREAAKEQGLTLQEVTVSSVGDVSQAAQSLKGVDAIYVPTDNTVVDGLAAVIQFTESEKIPLIVGEGDSVEGGGIATWGINYSDLGYQTGQMALKILQSGGNPAEMPVETLTDIRLYVNKAAAERMGVELSDDLLGRADQVFE